MVVVARRHGISESLLYNWRSAGKATAPAAMCAAAAPKSNLCRSGYSGPDPNGERAASGWRRGSASDRNIPGAAKATRELSEITHCRTVLEFASMPWWNEKALSRVLRAMRNAI